MVIAAQTSTMAPLHAGDGPPGLIPLAVMRTKVLVSDQNRIALLHKSAREHLTALIDQDHARTLATALRLSRAVERLS